MEKEKLERISHLSRLSRERNLTDEEIKERMELRGQYIAEMKASLKHTLDNTYIQKPDGTAEKDNAMGFINHLLEFLDILIHKGTSFGK